MFNKLRFSALVILVLVSVLVTGCFGFLGSEPKYTVEGVVNNKTYNESVTPIVKADDDKTEITLLLNDKPFESGTTISVDNDYVLTIKAKLNKKEVVEEIKFTIATGSPEIQITGVEEGKYYSEPVTPVITIGEDNNRDGIEVIVTLNEEPYIEGTPIQEHGTYELVVTVKADDKEGAKEVKFEIGEPLTHSIGITEDLKGFQGDDTDIEYNTDPQFIKSGEGSLQAKTGPSGKGVRINRHQDHPDWLADWTPYEKIAVWMYVEDVTQLGETPVTFRIYSSSQKNHGWTLGDFENGWNLLEVNLRSLLEDETLEDMSEIFVEYIIRAAGDSVTVYLDEINLVKGDK